MMDTEKGRTSGAGSEEGGECGHLGYSLGRHVLGWEHLGIDNPASSRRCFWGECPKPQS